MLDSPATLDPFARELATYLADTLHVDVAVEVWAGSRLLPLFMAQRYRFYQTAIGGRPCLLIVQATDTDPSPADIAKHVALATPIFDGIVIFVSEQMTATTRHRLIGQGVAFVVPKNQLYIPQLAMDLRDHFRPPLKKRGQHLSPGAQLVLFYHILHGEDVSFTPSMLAEPLDFAAMSIGRAFDQLASFSLATVERHGRQKTLHYNAGRRALLDMSRTLLRSPVRGLHGVQFKGPRPLMLRAGETALAELTNLSPPQRPTYAILATGWREFFKQHDIHDVNNIEDAEAFIETWRYNPNSLSSTETVDPLSLHAQFWDHPDERVALAAIAVLETAGEKLSAARTAAHERTLLQPVDHEAFFNALDNPQKPNNKLQEAFERRLKSITSK